MLFNNAGTDVPIKREITEKNAGSSEIICL